MSYCRWKPESSDAYIYGNEFGEWSFHLLDVTKFDDTRVHSRNFATREALLEAMAQAQEQGFRVPQRVFDQLRQEIAAQATTAPPAGA